jgi:hypothetical protein
MDRDYAAYPNKVVCSSYHAGIIILLFTFILKGMLLDILDNLPRLRMSSNQFKMILWILKECKVADVPSYAAFRRMQEGLRELCGSTPKAYTSSIGNRFFVNDVRESIARVSCLFGLLDRSVDYGASRISPIRRSLRISTFIQRKRLDRSRRSGRQSGGKNSSRRS